MRREGSALAGAGTVMMKELGDNLSSTRMRLLELLVFLTGAGAVFATIGEVREVVGEDPFVFLRIFTTSKGETLPSFAAFLGFLIPIVSIALGFDSVNSEFNGKTMSRILAQPIYRDALLFGKFMAGLTTLMVMLSALWIFVIGLAIVKLGLPPGTEEVMRGFAFLIAAIAYGGVWLGLAMLFSVQFRSSATAALASLAVTPPATPALALSSGVAGSTVSTLKSLLAATLPWARRARLPASSLMVLPLGRLRPLSLTATPLLSFKPAVMVAWNTQSVVPAPLR
jgi:ABC-2 type transport system permease protein